MSKTGGSLTRFYSGMLLLLHPRSIYSKLVTICKIPYPYILQENKLKKHLTDNKIMMMLVCCRMEEKLWIVFHQEVDEFSAGILSWR